MAEALVGGAIVSAVINLVINKLVSPDVIGSFKCHKINGGLLNKMKATMRCINKVLNDAEEKQITDVAVKEWLNDLKDAVYEADDFLDEIACQATRTLELRPEIESCTDQLQGFLYSLVPCKKGMGEMQKQLKKILQNLEGLVRQKDALGLIEGIGGKPASKTIPTTSVVDEFGVYGREADKEAIMKMLLFDDTKGRRLDVIPIWGMPGVGKTTLAQLIYNDNTVTKWFDFKAWIHVSEEFNVLKVTKDILKKLTAENCDYMTEDLLHTELQEKLKEKKVLLVLDDVWSDNQDQWDFLLKPFIYVTQGSKIVITTRHESVASVKSTVPLFRLQVLDEGDCWLVFEKHAFDGGNSDEHPYLKRIGAEIVKKCSGLPLAARALGSLLRLKRDAEDWEKILRSNIWDLKNCSILPALRLSYHYLPPHLKQCFSYCGTFPKGYQYQKEKLVLLWMAEGFLGNMKMEEVGEEYFDDLVSRSFFQLSNADLSCFVMHDLFNDLAEFVSGEFCFRMEDDDSCQPSERTRHLFISGSNSNAFVSIYQAPCLRTIIAGPVQLEEALKLLEESCIHVFSLRFHYLRVLSLESLVEVPDSIGKLKHLRFLSLSSASIKRLPETVSTLHSLQTLILDYCICLTELPDSIGKLKHLQCLSVQETSIKRLPHSASGLLNLQTLNLNRCKKLVELPVYTMNLINLHYLDIRHTGLQWMPVEMGRLLMLKQLTDFFLGRSGSRMKELGKLCRLRGELCIWNLQNIKTAVDAWAARLEDKMHLQKLELRWDGDINVSLHYDVLGKMRPHTSLKSLSIVGYGGERFPSWVGETSFSNIGKLHLKGCKFLSSLPSLGCLSSLKDLSIEEFDGLMSIGPEFSGSPTPDVKPFPSLEILRFQRMGKLQQWLDKEGAFPVLRELYLIDCPNLRTIAQSYLPSLTTLVIINNGKKLPLSLPRCQVSVMTISVAVETVTMKLNNLSSGQYHLHVEGVDSLDDMLKVVEQVGCSPSNLDELEISYLHSLEYFPVNLFPSLKSLDFYKCPELRTFSVERNVDCFTSLNSLSFSFCPNLQSLFECMHSLLPSLVDLEIINCPELESFPEGGLPSKLRSLRIEHCDKLFANRMQWGLQQLPSLSEFRISFCCDIESFPDEMLLPCTLTSLQMCGLTNIKSLNYNGIKHLTSLRELEIHGCPNLQSMPEEGLPPSLMSLQISCCPLLEKSCERMEGADWPKISHIPVISFLAPATY